MFKLEKAYEFLKTVMKKNMIIVVAVSGGPDSMCLLHLLYQQKKEYNLKIIVAHVNHNLRKESKEEALFVKKVCDIYQIPFELKELNNLPSTNTEKSARIKRYEFLEKIVNKYQADSLMTAHHGDDLIETILMRLTRGSNFSGYAGFKKITTKKNYKLIRPLIYLTKEEIINYNTENHLEYRIDKTNQSDDYTRNRFRKNIVPFLHQENPKVHQKFLKFSEELDRINVYLEKITESILTTIYDFDKVNLHKFKELDSVLQVRVLEDMLKKEYEDKIYLVNDTHQKMIFDLIESKSPNKKINLPLNKTLEKSYQYLYFNKSHELVKKEYILKESLKLNEQESIIKIKTDNSKKSNDLLRLDSKEITLPLKVRTRKKGDVMTLKNVKGSKKVKDIFIDEKIPLEKRDQWPIVTDANEVILWVPGLKKSNFDKNNNEFYDIIYKYVVSEEKRNE